MQNFARIAAFPLALIGAATLAAPAAAAFPIYGNPGVLNPTAYGPPTALYTGYLRVWYVDSFAGFTTRLGATVNGVDRGLAFSNQGTAHGTMHNFGAINAGDLIDWYLNVADTGETYRFSGTGNPEALQHFYYAAYTGGDAGFPPAGAYFGFEDLPGGGDFDYNDMQWVASSSATVPEPMTWAMMILGFGVVGGAMRRRSVKVRFA